MCTTMFQIYVVFLNSDEEVEDTFLAEGEPTFEDRKEALKHAATLNAQERNPHTRYAVKASEPQ